MGWRLGQVVIMNDLQKRRFSGNIIANITYNTVSGKKNSLF
jgi:hypothetical protein